MPNSLALSCNCGNYVLAHVDNVGVPFLLTTSKLVLQYLRLARSTTFVTGYLCVQLQADQELHVD